MDRLADAQPLMAPLHRTGHGLHGRLSKTNEKGDAGHKVIIKGYNVVIGRIGAKLPNFCCKSVDSRD